MPPRRKRKPAPTQGTRRSQRCSTLAATVPDGTDLSTDVNAYANTNAAVDSVEDVTKAKASSAADRSKFDSPVDTRFDSKSKDEAALKAFKETLDEHTKVVMKVILHGIENATNLRDWKTLFVKCSGRIAEISGLLTEKRKEAITWKELLEAHSGLKTKERKEALNKIISSRYLDTREFKNRYKNFLARQAESEELQERKSPNCDILPRLGERLAPVAAHPAIKMNNADANSAANATIDSTIFGTKAKTSIAARSNGASFQGAVNEAGSEASIGTKHFARLAPVIVHNASMMDKPSASTVDIQCNSNHAFCHSGIVLKNKLMSLEKEISFKTGKSWLENYKYMLEKDCAAHDYSDFPKDSRLSPLDLVLKCLALRFEAPKDYEAPTIDVFFADLYSDAEKVYAFIEEEIVQWGNTFKSFQQECSVLKKESCNFSVGIIREYEKCLDVETKKRLQIELKMANLCELLFQLTCKIEPSQSNSLQSYFHADGVEYNLQETTKLISKAKVILSGLESLNQKVHSMYLLLQDDLSLLETVHDHQFCIYESFSKCSGQQYCSVLEIFAKNQALAERYQSALKSLHE
mmetsp:Transcript_22100/g.44431  ORF Transcript_22100/g.44431 Transcript_22100/m.44431 type:complete len:580 (+) Transcript_22100:132-1871(+)